MIDRWVVEYTDKLESEKAIMKERREHTERTTERKKKRKTERKKNKQVKIERNN